MLAANQLRDANVGIVTSYCHDGIAAADLVLDSPAPLRVFYDLDTPVTLESLRAGEPVAYIGPQRLAEFDLLLSFAGGAALDELRARLGARRAAPLYGSVDPLAHRPAPPREQYRPDLSYLGTYAADRQRALDTLFLAAARALPHRRFLLGGAQYPASFPWGDNVFFVHHVPPAEHPAFYCSSALTLNVTRAAARRAACAPARRTWMSVRSTATARPCGF